jgi:DNA (cytosine-5)-methyltransferase 1
VAFSEIDPFACAVLKAHHPDVPNYGDMNEYETWPAGAPGSVDLLVGGTPCQSFSVAGLRGGLADPRGNLMLVYLRLLEKYRPRWCVWENVPGVLSSNGGRDFGALLGGLAKLGYGFAYRVLDAQYVRVESHPRAVPQRRRRVFVVGCLGDWRAAAEVLLEPEGVRGYPPSRRSSRQGAASGARLGAASGDAAVAVCVATSPTLRAGANKTGGDRPPGTDVDTVETLICVPDPAYALSAGAPGSGGAFGSGRDSQDTFVVSAVAGPLARNTGPNGHDSGNFASSHAVGAGHVVGFQSNRGTRGGDAFADMSPTLRLGRSSGAVPPAVAFSPSVFCLAERSRDGEKSLEARDDGTSNYLFTPNGGRAGIGVGAVAICPSVADTITSHEGKTYTNEGKRFRTHNVVPTDWPLDVAPTMNGEWHGRMPGSSNQDFTSQKGGMYVPTEPIPFNPEQITHPANGSRCEPGDPCGTISRHAPRPSVASVRGGVRRLTPTECERLQGFPDGHTNVEFHGKPATDGHRYKALGNSMAVNVMRFVGERIDNYEKSKR